MNENGNPFSPPFSSFYITPPFFPFHQSATKLFLFPPLLSLSFFLKSQRFHLSTLARSLAVFPSSLCEKGKTSFSFSQKLHLFVARKSFDRIINHLDFAAFVEKKLEKTEFWKRRENDGGKGRFGFEFEFKLSS